eukprot:CAMPEP_0197264110 /NCGR_PEP_ID=MMETSP1432-20130617/1600_1 /TAXON_ID=44447 /ORGANISM="Pseudo-nitzschia delicatissima, Strain UNC1205" /LENGTH=515 /DNA_ID=CAMNT_0042728723 /DNA_START=59 /DNA_END=1606 /DNA_ORIENTATION=-
MSCFRKLGRLLVLLLCLRRTVCLASSSSPSPHLPLDNDDGENRKQQPLRIESLNKYGGNVKYFDLVDEGTATDPGKVSRRPTIRNPLGGKIVPALRTTFLPVGFPDKTPHGYLRFCVWSWIQDVSTQLRSVLATQKILEGVGVGREGATALSALFNYLVRDGCGMAANLLFTYAASSRFRSDIKRWRLFADMSVDIGITLEVTAILLPKSFFLPCICLGNMFKALCGVAAGASGGSINLYWAKGSDISDINAKFGAQNTVSGAIGLVCAGLFAKSVNEVAPQSLWLMYIFLTVLHLYANVKCMRMISFDYVNTIRLDMILRDYVRKGDDTSIQMSTPQEIAKTEPLWFLRIPAFRRIFAQRKTAPAIHFGIAYDEFCKRSGKPMEDLKSEIVKAKPLANGKSRSEGKDKFDTIDDRYIISTGKTEKSKPCVVVSFLSDVSPEQQTKAYVHARLLANALQKEGSTPVDYERQLEIEAEAKSRFAAMWGEFLKSCTGGGWDLSRSELRTRGYEVKVV